MDVRGTDIEFLCPECDSTYWTTDFTSKKQIQDKDAILKRRCKECNFRWTNDEDWKYFYKIVPFKSDKEYQEFKINR